MILGYQVSQSSKKKKENLIFSNISKSITFVTLKILKIVYLSLQVTNEWSFSMYNEKSCMEIQTFHEVIIQNM